MDYSVREVAELLNCSPVNIYRYVKCGALEAYRKLGRHAKEEEER